MRLYTTAQGLLSRTASLQLMVPSFDARMPLASLLASVRFGGSNAGPAYVCLKGGKCGDTTRTAAAASLTLSDVRKNPAVGGEVSAVLYIEGVGLTDARLYFENRELKVIPLTFQKGGFANKYTPSSAFIVLETTRSIPGWLDVSLDAEMETLMNGDMPKADGTFYVLIEDQFGRQEHVDLGYVSWHLTRQDIGNNSVHEDFSYTSTHRWWDPSSNGTTPLGKSPWSESKFVHVDWTGPKAQSGDTRN